MDGSSSEEIPSSVFRASFGDLKCLTDLMRINPLALGNVMIAAHRLPESELIRRLVRAYLILVLLIN
jgi:hypothetical protein